MKHSVRIWHTWTSVGIGVPLLLVGLTTFFIAHEKSLGTKEILIPAAWLAGSSAAGDKPTEIRASARIGGERWLGTKDGVYRVDGAGAVPLEGSPADEIRGFALAGDAVLLAGKKGLWRYADAQGAKILDGDCWHVAAEATGYSAACKDLGLLVSADGVRWDEIPVAFPTIPAAQPQGVPLSKLIMDVHTGKLFLGKKGEWIWIDALGLTIVALALTGLLMWMRGRRARASAGGPAGGTTRAA